MSEPSAHESHDEHKHHIVSPAIYVTILLCLLVCTAATVWASYIDLGETHLALSLGSFHLDTGFVIFWNPVVALAIAATKMILVVLFFMHIKYSSKLTQLTVGAGLFTFFVLVAMTLADYVSRAWGRW
jgi:cytochrome c oxidase subunit 4